MNSDFKSYFLVARGFQLWRLATVAYQKVGHLGSHRRLARKQVSSVKRCFFSHAVGIKGLPSFFAESVEVAAESFMVDGLMVLLDGMYIISFTCTCYLHDPKTCKDLNMNLNVQSQQSYLSISYSTFYNSTFLADLWVSVFFENVDISCMLLSLTQTDASTKCIPTPAKLLHFLGANFNLPTW